MSASAERIPGAELVLVPGAGHMLQVDADGVVRGARLELGGSRSGGKPVARRDDARLSGSHVDQS
ncbi:MAG: hypothetical protein E6J75_07555, partial [Deltaproteobacteria bacterium]